MLTGMTEDDWRIVLEVFDAVQSSPFPTVVTPAAISGRAKAAILPEIAVLGSSAA